MYYLSLPSSVLQLPQPGASLDNRVPTPAPAASADLHAQHVGADLPVKEVKAEPHQETGGKTEPKMEVSLALCKPNLIYLPVYWFILNSTNFFTPSRISPRTYIIRWNKACGD